MLLPRPPRGEGILIGSGIAQVIEYELADESLSLANVTVKIPAPSAANPEVRNFFSPAHTLAVRSLNIGLWKNEELMGF